MLNYPKREQIVGKAIALLEPIRDCLCRASFSCLLTQYLNCRLYSVINQVFLDFLRTLKYLVYL